MCVFVVGGWVVGRACVHVCVCCRLHALALTEVWDVQYGGGGGGVGVSYQVSASVDRRTAGTIAFIHTNTHLNKRAWQ